MSVRRAVYWSYAGQVSSAILMFAGSVIVARLLSPTEFGIYAIAAATQGAIGVLTAFGVSSWVVSHSDLQPQDLDGAFTVNAAIMLALSAVLLAVSFAARPLLGNAAAGQVLRVLAINPLVGIASFRSGAMLQRNLQFKTISIIGVVTGVVSTGTVIISAWLGASYMSVAYGSVAGGVLALAATVAAAPRYVSWRLSLAGSRQILAFGLNMVSVSGVSALGARLSEVALGRLLGLTTLGLYSRASGISALLWENIYATATRVSFSQLSLDARTTGDVRPTFLRSLSLILAVLWPMQLGLASLAAPVINLIYGARWVGAATPLTILLLAQALAMTFGMNWELFVVRGELRVQTRYELMRSVGGFVVFVAGCFFSLTAATFGRMTDVALGVVFYRKHVNRLARLLPGELTSVCLRSALVSAGAVAPPLLFRIMSGWPAQLPVAPMLGSIALGGVFWIAIAAWLDHPIYQEISKIVSTLGRVAGRRPAV